MTDAVRHRTCDVERGANGKPNGRMLTIDNDRAEGMRMWRRRPDSEPTFGPFDAYERRQYAWEFARKYPCQSGGPRVEDLEWWL